MSGSNSTNVTRPVANRNNKNKSTGGPNQDSSKTSGPPGDASNKPQVTAEQLRLAQMLSDTKDSDDPELMNKIKQIIELTHKTHDEVVVALHDCDNDPNLAIEMLLEGDDHGEWRTLNKKSRKQPAAPAQQQGASPKANARNGMDAVAPQEPPDTRPEGEQRPNRGRGGSRGGIKDHRGDAPPRLSRGGPPRMVRMRGRERGGGGFFSERNKENFEDNRPSFGERRGRGRGMMNGPSRGGMRGRGGGRSRTFQNRGTRDSFPSSIDTWSNSTAEQGGDGGEPPMAVGNWDNSFPAAEDWDNEDYTGSLSETKVFTPSNATTTTTPALGSAENSAATYAASLESSLLNSSSATGLNSALSNSISNQGATLSQTSYLSPSAGAAGTAGFPPTSSTSTYQSQSSVQSTSGGGVSIFQSSQVDGSGSMFPAVSASGDGVYAGATGTGTAYPTSPSAAGYPTTQTTTATYQSMTGGSSFQPNQTTSFQSTGFQQSQFPNSGTSPLAFGAGTTSGSSAGTGQSTAAQYNNASAILGQYAQKLNDLTSDAGKTQPNSMFQTGYDSVTQASVYQSANYSNSFNNSSIVSQAQSLTSQLANNTNAQSVLSKLATGAVNQPGSQTMVTNSGALPQRSKPARTRTPAPSKIPSSAVEMPEDAIAALEALKFESLEFGTEPEFGATDNSALQTPNSNPPVANHLGSSLSGGQAATLSSSMLASQAALSSKPPPGLSNDSNRFSTSAGSGYTSTGGYTTQNTPPNLTVKDLSAATALSQITAGHDALSSYTERKTASYSTQRTPQPSDSGKNDALGSYPPSTTPQAGYASSYISQQAKASSYPVTSAYTGSPYGSGNQPVTGSQFQSMYSSGGVQQGSTAVYSGSAGGTYSATTQASYTAGSTAQQLAAKLSGTSLSGSGKESALDVANAQHVYDGSHTSATSNMNSALTTMSSANASLNLGTTTTTASLSNSKSTVCASNKPGVPIAASVPMLGHQLYIGQSPGMPVYAQPQPLYTYEDLILQQRFQLQAQEYYNMPSFSTPTTLREGSLPNVGGYSATDSSKFSRGDTNSPVPTTLAAVQQQSTAAAATQQYISPTLPHGYSWPYYSSVLPGVLPQYGTPIFPVPPATNTHGTSSNNQYQKTTYGSHTYSSGYENLSQAQDYPKTAYAASNQTSAKSMSAAAATLHSGNTGNSNSTVSDLAGSYGKAHSQVAKSFQEKPGFHASPPPAFNLAGNQAAGPLGVGPTFPSTFVPYLLHHPNMSHADTNAQNSGSSQRVGSNTGPGNSANTGNKGSATTKPSYQTNYWGATN